MPTFAPLRAQLNHMASSLREGETMRKEEDGYVLQTPWHMELPADTKVSKDFTLADLTEGECVVAGHTTRGAWEMGVYLGASPGRYLNFDGSQQGSLLWSNLCLIRGSLADRLLDRHKKKANWYKKLQAKLDTMRAAGEITDNIGTPDVSDDEACLPPGPMKRTDSGTSYGFTGYPDVEFWARSGIVADAFVPAHVYNGHGAPEEADWYRDAILQLRGMNHADITPAMQAAINKQAGAYVKTLEELTC
jgi:hypothetical protein